MAEKEDQVIDEPSEEEISEEENEVLDEEVKEKPSEEEPEEEESDDMVIAIGDEEPEEEEHEKAPQWIRDLRKAHRDTQRENRELKAKLEEAEKAEIKPVSLGPKPTLDDYDYDTDQYSEALDKWYERKRIADENAKRTEDEKEAAEKAWKATLDDYGEKKTELKSKVKNFDEAESLVQSLFSQTQQGIILQGADNSALLIAGIGNNHDLAVELSSITDPIKFAFRVARLEKDMKIKSRKAPPPPEKKVEGTGSKSGAVDSTLENLRKEAARTGDYTKVTQYRRQKMRKT